MYELNVNYGEVSRYLGITSEKLDVDTRTEIEEVVRELNTIVNEKVEYKVFDIRKTEQAIHIEGTNLNLEGDSIQALLRDCNQCILLAVTLGQSVDAHLRTMEIKNLAHAVVTDFCASSMVEQLCNQVEEQLRKAWSEKGKYLTDRFSPGYGDLPLESQKSFCRILDTSRKMGLHVSSSGLMIPRKSITAVIGIADTKQRMKIKGCKYCDFYKECEYRKGGKSCD